MEMGAGLLSLLLAAYEGQPLDLYISPVSIQAPAGDLIRPHLDGGLYTNISQLGSISACEIDAAWPMLCQLKSSRVCTGHKNLPSGLHHKLGYCGTSRLAVLVTLRIIAMIS